MQRVVTGSSIFFALLAFGVGACGPGGRQDGDDDTPPMHIIDGGNQPDGSGPPTQGPPYPDFPAQPIVDGEAPANAGELFNAPNAPTGVGPCLAEPQIGTLFPNAFLRPRFTLAPGGGQNLFEIRIHAADESNDLLVYTSNKQWTMPADLWAKMSLHLVDKAITVSVRGAVYANGTLTAAPALGTTGDIYIAPVGAGGSIVYWTTSNGTALKGFKVGEEAAPQVVLKPKNAGVADPGCIGCHSLTPDGKYLSFSWVVGPDGFPGRVDLREPLTTDPNEVTKRPDFITDTAMQLLSRTAQHAPVYSAGHWQNGDHLALSMLQTASITEIIWTDLEATSMAQGMGWDVVTRAGDNKSAAAAAFSHDGKRIAYVSGTLIDSGVRNHAGDIWTVPFNNRLGGTATPLPGASDPAVNESYPSFSADDQLIAFTRTDEYSSNPPSYDNRSAEVFVIPADGGTPVRLKANDGNSCSGGASPGLTNSWPKWSPGPIENRNGKKYYWLTFSSRRPGAPHLPQLYVAPVVWTEAGLETYPAIYLWNQPANEANHTPAWDNLQIQ
jgi:WD40-like Beta Propeller Repeat